MTIGLWNRSIPAAPTIEAGPVNDRSTAVQTLNDWAERGYSLWRCSALGGRVIMVVDRDRPAAAPRGYPVFTLEELALTEDLPDSTLRLIISAKLAGDAVVTKVEERK